MANYNTSINACLFLVCVWIIHLHFCLQQKLIDDIDLDVQYVGSTNLRPKEKKKKKKRKRKLLGNGYASQTKQKIVTCHKVAKIYCSNQWLQHHETSNLAREYIFIESERIKTVNSLLREITDSWIRNQLLRNLCESTEEKGYIKIHLDYIFSYNLFRISVNVSLELLKSIFFH